MDNRDTSLDREIELIKKKITEIKTPEGKIQYLKEWVSSLQSKSDTKSILLIESLRMELNRYQTVMNELKQTGGNSSRGDDVKQVQLIGNERGISSFFLLLEEIGLVNRFGEPVGVEQRQSQIQNLLLNITQFCTQHIKYIQKFCKTFRDTEDDTIALGVVEICINRLAQYIRESQDFLEQLDELNTAIRDLENQESKRKLLREFSTEIYQWEDILRLLIRMYASEQNRFFSLYAKLQAGMNPTGDSPEVKLLGPPTDSRKSKKSINWTGSNKLDILALFELLENAGLIAPGSCKNAGSIISATFQKDGEDISRKYINTKKRDPLKYLKQRLKLMEKIITNLDTAYDKLSKLEENNEAPDYLAD